jgi:hypothetical protein
LLWLVAFLSKVAHFPAVEAWKLAGGKMMWWPGGSLLWWWGRSTVELLLLLLWLLLILSWLELWTIAPIVLLLWSTRLTPRWGIHQVVSGRSTTRTTTTSGSRHHLFSLLLINLGNYLHHSLLINGRTHQLIVQQAGEMYQALP